MAGRAAFQYNLLERDLVTYKDPPAMLFDSARLIMATNYLSLPPVPPSGIQPVTA